MPTVEHRDRTYGDARSLHVDEQKRDARLGAALARGSHETEDPVGVLGERRPGFLAVHDIDLATPLGACLEGGEIGARPGLRIALTPPMLAIEDAGQEVLLLRLIAEGHDDRSDPARAEGQHWGRPGERALLFENQLTRGVPFLASKSLWPTRCDPAAGVEDPHPTEEVRAFQALVTEHLVANRTRQLCRYEGTHFIAETLFLG